jgi:integrase
MEPRIYGPYKHRNRWRIVVYDADGGRTTRVCETYDEAAELVRQLDTQLPASPILRVGTVLERYAAFMTYKGNKPESIATTNYRLRAFFADVRWEPLRRIDRAVCQRLYDKQVATTSVDTHRNVLGQVKTFFDWCVRHRYLTLNPVERIRPVGRRQHGKPQLRVDEARTWMREAKELADAGKHGAIAAMMALLMGMRCGEIVRCVACDVDDGGRLLWIPVSKTRAGKRMLEIPTDLRRHLLRVAEGRPPLTRLFPYQRAWVYRWVRRLCAPAGTPIVCAHAMRGLHSTLAIDAGMTPSVVAFALGHKSPRATLQSYADPNAVARAKQRRVVAVLRRRPSK